jgi:hypothetical protein
VLGIVVAIGLTVGIGFDRTWWIGVLVEREPLAFMLPAPLPSDTTAPNELHALAHKFVGGAGRRAERRGARLASAMLYEVLVISSGGERFTIERDAPLAGGDIFEEDSESYRVLAIETGHGPFAGVIEAERLSSAEFPR